MHMERENCVRVYLIVSLTLLFLAFTNCRPSGIELSITNRGAVTIDSLRIFVTGNTYVIERLNPGNQESILLHVTGESHVELTHSGLSDTLVVDSYFEPGYRGFIDLDITEDAILSKRMNISHW